MAWGLISFKDIAAYRRYCAAVQGDAEARANLRLAQAGRFILREESSWLEEVTETRNRTSLAARAQRAQ